MEPPPSINSEPQNLDSEDLAKSYFIHTTPTIQLGDTNSVPTALYYEEDSSYLVGTEAINRAAENEDIPNLIHDFKVALGNQGKSGLGELFPCSDGKDRAASTLTGQFLRKLLITASEKIAEHEISESAHVIVAEPIRVHGEENSSWLASYRNQIRSILADREWKDIHNIKFSEVEFLPEPFAVFNYYRHGLRHAQIIGSESYRVLVVDIGGGTTDCSVIETAVSGEVKKSGKTQSLSAPARTR